ncbi:MAG: flagellin, partial [Rhodocyclaceae bacterium]|nr:flagellin [Rhodocyclaceae bacterium]
PDPIDAPQEVRQVKDEVTDGDRFEIYVASTNMLDNLAMFAVALEKPGASRNTGAVAFALDNLDAAQENVLRVRAQIGSQMVETEQLANLGSDLNIQYAEAISRLEDVDYAEAISRLTQQQTYLQAAQQSFMRVTGLSLFNYLN